MRLKTCVLALGLCHIQNYAIADTSSRLAIKMQSIPDEQFDSAWYGSGGFIKVPAATPLGYRLFILTCDHNLHGLERPSENDPGAEYIAQVWEDGKLHAIRTKTFAKSVFWDLALLEPQLSAEEQEKYLAIAPDLLSEQDTYLSLKSDAPSNPKTLALYAFKHRTILNEGIAPQWNKVIPEAWKHPLTELPNVEDFILLGGHAERGNSGGLIYTEDGRLAGITSSQIQVQSQAAQVPQIASDVRHVDDTSDSDLSSSKVMMKHLAISVQDVRKFYFAAAKAERELLDPKNVKKIVSDPSVFVAYDYARQRLETVLNAVSFNGLTFIEDKACSFKKVGGDVIGIGGRIGGDVIGIGGRIDGKLGCEIVVQRTPKSQSTMTWPFEKLPYEREKLLRKWIFDLEEALDADCRVSIVGFESTDAKRPFTQVRSLMSFFTEMKDPKLSPTGAKSQCKHIGVNENKLQRDAVKLGEDMLKSIQILRPLANEASIDHPNINVIMHEIKRIAELLANGNVNFVREEKLEYVTSFKERSPSLDAWSYLFDYGSTPDSKKELKEEIDHLFQMVVSVKSITEQLNVSP